MSGVAKVAFKLRAERGFARALDRGGMRRPRLRGRTNVHTRDLRHVVGCNLGLIMRRLTGHVGDDDAQGAVLVACVGACG